MKARMTPKEVAARLNVGTRAVYTMLEQGILPGIRLGQRWLITRHAYGEWERTCGMQPVSHTANRAGLHPQPEVTVLN
jgi:excisionase family DNA binding protein